MTAPAQCFATGVRVRLVAAGFVVCFVVRVVTRAAIIYRHVGGPMAQLSWSSTIIIHVHVVSGSQERPRAIA